MLFIDQIKKELDGLTYSENQLNELSKKWSEAAGEEVKVIQFEDENEVLVDIFCCGSELGMLRLFAMYAGRNCDIERMENGNFKFTKHGALYDPKRWSGAPANTIDELLENAASRATKSRIFVEQKIKNFG